MLTYTFAITLHRSASVSGGVYSVIGSLQYSRLLGLSIGNHYILYLKAMTARMPFGGSVFHNGHEVALVHRFLARSVLPSFTRLAGRRTTSTKVKIQAFLRLGCGCGRRRDAAFGSRQGHRGSRLNGPALVGEAHGHVNIFKNQAGRDTTSAIG